MSWDRTSATQALAAAIEANLTALADTASVFDTPPATLNASAIVIGRITEVRYSDAIIGIDTAELPVSAVAGLGDDARVTELLSIIRSSVPPGNATLGGAVQICVATAERNWRHMNIAGADLSAADVIFTIRM